MSPTWQPHKIVPPPRPKAKRGPAPDAECFWCGEDLQDKGEDGFKILWSAGGDFGCDASPASCHPWEGWHFHGYDGQRNVPHTPEEAESMLEPFEGEEGLLDYCATDSHQTIGQINRLLGVQTISRDEYVADRYQSAIEREARISARGPVEPHCEDGTCKKADCHRCNPDWMCPEHSSCINSITCPACERPRGNVRIKGARTVHVTPQPYGGSKFATLYGLQDMDDINEYVYSYMDDDDRYDEDGNIYVNNAWDFDVLDNPVCINSKCRLYAGE